MDSFDYRGSTSNTEVEKPTNVQNTESPATQNVPKKQQYVYPKKEQAIVLNAIDNLTLTDYLEAIATLTDPKNILFASRMSNKRICMYLSSAELANEIAGNTPTIKIHDEEITIRLLIIPSKRLILSNVCPSIPCEFLEETLKGMKIKTLSPITILKAGTTQEKFSHIYSFRRQVYIQADNNMSLPSYMVIKFEDTNHRIYINHDDMLCFTCKLRGHLARQCPLNQHEPTIIQNNESIVPPNDPNATDTTSKKRPASSISSTITTEQDATSAPELITGESESQITTHDPEFVHPRYTIKKQKRLKKSDSQESLTPIEEIMEPAKVFFGIDPKPSITYEQIIDFISNLPKNPDPLSLAKNYTNNIDEMLEILTKIYPYIKHRGTKIRLNSVKKKIRKQLNNEADETSGMETDSSSQTSY